MSRETYSMHKHRCLAKPMMIVSTSGHIIEVFGPYKGKVNDASIVVDDLARAVQERDDRAEWERATEAEAEMSSDEEVDFPNRDPAEPSPELKKNAQRLLDYQEEKDIDILDRGYRDAIKFLKVIKELNRLLNIV